MFGLEPNYGCCTANFNQGWPKLCESAFARSAKGIASCVFVPAQVDTTVNGARVSVSLDTSYPFRGKLIYTVKTDREVEFDLDIRVPAFSTGMTINGEAIAAKRGFATMRRVWSGETTVTVDLTFAPKLVNRPHALKTAEYGPLVFALKIENEKKKIEYEARGVDRTFPYCDWSISPTSEWQFGFASDTLTPVEHPEQESAFMEVSPMLTLRANLVPLDWGYRDGYTNVCAMTPKSRKPQGEARKVELYPYGCAKLRMTEMPLIPKR